MKKRPIRSMDAGDGCIKFTASPDATTRIEIGELTICPSEVVKPSKQKTLRVGWLEVVDLFRRRGVATQLYEAAAKEACRRGVPLQSDTELSANARKFWNKQVAKGRAVPAKMRIGAVTRDAFILKCPVDSLAGRRRKKRR